MKRFLRRGLVHLTRRAAPRSAPRSPPVAARPFDRPTDAIHANGEVTFEVPLERCCYPLGTSYAASGWHPFTATLRAYAAGRERRYEGSLLQRFYATFQPRDLLELLFPPPVVEAHRDAALARYRVDACTPFLPWDVAVNPRRGEGGLGPEHGHQGFGPVTDAKGRMEHGRLVAALESLGRDGYRPPPNDGIVGYFLLRDGDYRFIVRSGLHRTAALSVLGYDRVPVQFVAGRARAVHAEQAPTWPLVRQGVYTEALARRFVAQFFESPTWLHRHVAPRVERPANGADAPHGPLHLTSLSPSAGGRSPPVRR